MTNQTHASAVAFGENACLITGGSGKGKSTLALELLAFGGQLIADDRVDLLLERDVVLLACPPGTKGLIEARRIGLICTTSAPSTPARLWVDLDEHSSQRLPHLQNRDLLGRSVPVIFGPYRPGLAAAVKLLLTGGILSDPDRSVAP